MLLTNDEQETLRSTFVALLDARRNEEEYQRFLEEHPHLIPREFIQNHGLHLDLIFSKLRLAADYTTDFFYLAKSSADWNCVFVEIEKPHSRFFKNNNAFHSDFVTALSQITRWKAWLNAPGNRAHLIDYILQPVRKPLEENHCYFKFVLVHGRREEYSGSKLRRDLIQASESDDFKIMSYDSLLDGIRCNHDAYIAARRNEYVELQSGKYISDQALTVVDVNDLRVSRELYDDIVNSRDRWFTFSNFREKALETIVPKLQIINSKRA